MLDFVKVFLSKSWEFFSIKWPGFNFSIGTVFLAVAASVGALSMICKMIGVGGPSGMGDVVGGLYDMAKPKRQIGFQYGGNNRNIKISKERKNDRK